VKTAWRRMRVAWWAMADIVSVEGLSFRYRHTPNPALLDISLSIQAGEFVGIVGPAGAGKTTLLNSLSGIVPHYYSGDLRGEVTVDGRNVAECTFHDLASHVGIVFEDPDFQMVSILVEEEVAFGPENLGIPPQEIERRVQAALLKTHISHLRDRVISTLSGGEKQRVAVSSVLSMLPPVLLLDEPTSELDPIGAHEVFSALRELNHHAGITIVMVSQDMERLVESADRILLLRDGRLLLDGPPREICLSHPILEMAGIRVPQVVEFTLSLFSRMNHPLSAGELPLTVDEAAALLQTILIEAGVGS
jgi:energy-coupling factor transporter ATP-binding protein EcfA2